jgi:isochorismate hydrolase
MKEKYYALETIDLQAEKFLQLVKPLRERRKWTLYRNNVALLTLDMQRYFLDESSHAHVPSGKAIIPKLRKLQDEFLKRNLTVVQTRHLNTPEDAGQMGKWWKEIIVASNPLSQIVDELSSDKIPVICKTQYDAFWNTNLEEILRSRGVQQVVIAGVMTHLCCETTARSAFIRGFEVFFTVDGTATYNKDFHLSTLLNLSHGFAIPVLIREVIDYLGEKSDNRSGYHWRWTCWYSHCYPIEKV